MRVLCAPDKFKGTLTAAQAAAAMARGVERAGHEAVTCPVADGGDGSIDVLLAAFPGVVSTVEVCGPFGEPVTARWAAQGGGLAIIELAEASGLKHVPPGCLNPLKATTFGAGELIVHALAAGCRDAIIFVGGSATVDGGAGAAQALGAQFFDRSGGELETPMGGGALSRVARFALPTKLRLTPLSMRIACDVGSPLLGPRGAARVFGPQKGATAEQVETLEAGLRHWASVIGGDPDQRGAGAAGGIGFGLSALFGAELVRGANLVLDLIQFDQHVSKAHLVLTGEGQLDEQTLEGKAVMAVAQASARARVPVAAIVGQANPTLESLLQAGPGVQHVRSLVEEFGEWEALRQPGACLERLTALVVAEHFGS